MPSEALRQSSAVGWHCGHDDSPGSSTQLILSRSPHSSSGNGARAVELWDRLGYRYEAALALLDTKDEAQPPRVAGPAC